jgi:hypothetical protein
MNRANSPTWNAYPNLPWIHFLALPGRGFHVRDTRTGETVSTADMRGVHQFAADHSQGLGTAVHKVTSAMGIPRCGACAKRQASMNGGGLGAMFKSLFR